MEYENTDCFGNTIYKDEETGKLYSFTDEEIEGKLLEDFPWEGHEVKFYMQNYYGKPVYAGTGEE